MIADDPDPLELAQLVASSEPRDRRERWLRDGLTAWLKAGGELPLERCLQLERTPARLRLANRNVALRRAWRALGDADSQRRRAYLLAEELRRFCGAVLPRWREAGGPPRDASALRLALWDAVEAAPELAERGLGWRQLLEVVQRFPMEAAHDSREDEC